MSCRAQALSPSLPARGSSGGRGSQGWALRPPVSATTSPLLCSKASGERTQPHWPTKPAVKGSFVRWETGQACHEQLSSQFPPRASGGQALTFSNTRSRVRSVNTNHRTISNCFFTFCARDEVSKESSISSGLHHAGVVWGNVLVLVTAGSLLPKPATPHARRPAPRSPPAHGSLCNASRFRLFLLKLPLILNFTRN